MRSSTLHVRFLVAVAALGFAASEAAAQQVDLVGASATTTGTQKIKIDGYGRCKAFFGLDLDFLNATDVSAADNLAVPYTGVYKQRRRKQGRNVKFTLDRTSKRSLKQGIKDAIRGCIGGGKVRIGIDRLTLKGTVSEAFDSIVVRAVVRVSGSAGGERGEATFSFKTEGPLVLAGG